MPAGISGHEGESSIGVGYSAQPPTTPDLGPFTNRTLNWLAEHRLTRHVAEVGAFVAATAPYAPVIIDKLATGKPITFKDFTILAALSGTFGSATTTVLEVYTRMRSIYIGNNDQELARQHQLNLAQRSKDERVIHLFEESGVVRFHPHGDLLRGPANPPPPEEPKK